MQKITPCLWFDNNLEEAADFYTSIFSNSKIERVARYDKTGAEVSGMPEGSVMSMSFLLEGQQFMGINGGPIFQFTPATSFVVNCDTEADVEKLFEELSNGGKVLMPLDKYFFSEKFAWVGDRFGLTWQLNLKGRDQKIAPALMFVGDQFARAEEAINYYVSQFPNSKVSSIRHYAAGEHGVEGTVKHAIFSIEGYEIMAMDGEGPHQFSFTPAVSFMINCQNQAEVDKLWKTFMDGGQSQNCGWVKDKFDFTWQVVPTVLNEMLQSEDKEKAKRVMEAMLKMQKLDIVELTQAYTR